MLWTKLVQQKSNIFDEPIPNNLTPVLQTTPWRPSNITTKVKQNKKNSLQKNMQMTKKMLYYGYAKDERFWRLVVELHTTKTKSSDKVLESFKNKIKKIMKREIVCSNQHSPNLL